MEGRRIIDVEAVSYTHLRAHETVLDLVCRLLLEKNFSDLKAGQKMLISSPEKIAEYIKNIPEGIHKTSKEMRLDLAKVMGADNSCPVSTGIFLRKAIEEHGKEIPFWRLIDENHPLVKKLNLDPKEIKYMRNLEGID